MMSRHWGGEEALGKEVQKAMSQRNQLAAVGGKSKKIRKAHFCIGHC
jgi:hypothetical protein